LSIAKALVLCTLLPETGVVFATNSMHVVSQSDIDTIKVLDNQAASLLSCCLP